MKDDSISRQEAIDKLNERQRKLIYCFGFENDMVKIMDIAKSIIIAMPSAEPEQRWIPCSERLPEENVSVICNKPSKYFDPKIAIGYYNGIRWVVDGWEQITDQCDAWMPLPEPYKAEE